VGGLIEGMAGPFVIWISDYFEQRLHAIASDRRNDPELGKMGTDGVDHRGLLADEQMARAMEHQAALLLGRLGLCRVLENEMSGAYFSAEFAWQVKRNPV